MKKVYLIGIFCFLFFPFIVKASMDYEDAINFANKFLDNAAYSDHNAYLLKGKDKFHEDNRLINSGFLTKKEYDISNFNNSSYLSPGIEYWTSTLFVEGQRNVINYSLFNKNETDSSGVRVTQHVKPNVVVSGNGSKSNPWVFLKQYNLILSSNKYGNISPLKQYVASGSNATVNLYPLFGYKYVGNTCEKDTGMEYITKKTDTGFEFTIKNMNKNLVCEVNFGPKNYEFSLYGSKMTTQAVPQKITLYYSDGWYNGNTKITKITPPKRTGYLFGGYTYESKNVIDSSGNILSGNEKIIEAEKDSYEMEAKWTAVTYKIAYNGNGATSGSMSASTHTYDVSYNLSSNTFTKSGYKFTGWNTKADGTGTAYANNAAIKNLSAVANYTVNLYAQWSAYKVTVKFNSNTADSITRSVVNSGTTYYWKLNSNNNIARSTDGSTYTESFFVKSYEASIDLPNYNNSSYINLSRQGFAAVEGKEWCTSSDGTGTCFNQNSSYTAAALCPGVTSNNCSVTLYANWKPTAITYEDLINDYYCANASAGSAPYVLKYTGNCSVIDDTKGLWRVKFLTSGTLTLSSDLGADVFLVGGGGGGSDSDATWSGWDGQYYYGGGGGGGGYTKTQKGIKIAGSTNYSIVIGAGGAKGNNACAGTGGTSSAFGYSAAGGNGGCKGSETSGGGGGNGGSGGGDYAFYTPKPGGSNGASSGGTGQGTNTYEFGETGRALYAGGGAGGRDSFNWYAVDAAASAGGGGATAQSGTANTGGGGGGGRGGNSAGAGGSGVVIIRNIIQETGDAITFNKLLDHYICNYSSGSTDGLYFTYTGSCAMVNDGGTDWKLTFTSSGTLKVYDDFDIDSFLVGGGGGGAGYSSGRGGNGGQALTTKNIKLTNGSSYAITIGAGGAGGSSSSYGSAGGNTTAFGLTAKGGTGGGNSANGYGSVGGVASYEGSCSNANGKSYGNGGQYTSSSAQTTCEFNEAVFDSNNNVVGCLGRAYAAGGGARCTGEGCAHGNCGSSGGTYGGGDGAGGIDGYSQGGGSATANTGSGGGGGSVVQGNYGGGGKGGSGIVIIRNVRE